MPPAGAAAFTVTNLADSGPGSLRQAITDANANPGADTIDFAPSLTGTITLASQLSINDSVTIAGPGADKVAVSGNDVNRVFDLSEGSTGFAVTVSGLTLTDGFFSGSGGAIGGFNVDLTVRDAAIKDSRSYLGGAISITEGSLTVEASTISGNQAFSGGAFAFYGSTGGSIAIRNSTIHSNSASQFGGALFADAESGTNVVTVVSSTISNNSAGDGGALRGDIDASILHSTLVGNEATGTVPRDAALGVAALPIPGFGDTFSLTGGALVLSHSIVSGVTTNTYPDYTYYTSVTANRSLVRTPIGLLLGANNIVGVDPLLGALADNGGTTLTHLPLTGSPAINAGDPAVAGAPTTDQRGLARIAGGRIDIGAVETAPPAPPCSFNSFNPKRVLDTRNGIGGPKATIGPAGTITVQVAGVAGLPTTGIKAVIANITAAQSTEASYVTAWPADSPQPTATSTLNTEPGQDVPNTAIVGLSADGKISLYNNTGSTNLIVDVMGYLGTCSTFTPVGPARLLDTRNGIGAPIGKVGAGQSIAVQATGVGGVPASGVDSVVVNLTSTQASSASFITAWPTGATRPTASMLNTEPGVDVPNLAIVKLSADGRFSLFNEAGTTHLLADVVGYFPAAAPALVLSGPTGFTSITPVRFLDTRSSTGFAGPASAGRQYDVAVTGVPAGTKAVVINLTSTDSSMPGYVTAWQAGSAMPETSNLNTEPGTNVAAIAIVSLSADGKITVFNSYGTTHLVADVVGYFPPE